MHCRRCLLLVPSAGLLVLALVALFGSSARAAGTVPVPFAGEGPIGVFATAASGEGTEPWSGATTAVLPDPRHPNVALIATANGGIWHTTDLSDATPKWTAVSDHAPSLSISSVSFDPTVGVGDRVAIAGIGHRSAFGGRGGLLTGLLESTDSGLRWNPVGESDLSGVDVSGAAIRGHVIAVTSRRGTAVGVLVSTNSGKTFKLVSGTGTKGHPEPPVGPAFDLVGDPMRPDRLYAAVGGPRGGVYRSDDAGRTWTAQGGPTFGTGRNLAKDAVNMRIVVHASATAPSVWMAIAGPVADAQASDTARIAGRELPHDDDESGADGTSGNALDGLFRTVGTSPAWKALDVADPTDPVLSVNPGGQASVHLAVVSDPDNASVVYVGGDHEPGGTGGGQLLTCNATLPHGHQCRRIVREGTSNNSAPHADVRSLVFVGGRLLLGGDGGVYRDDDPSNPGAHDSRWTSLNGDLDAIETHSCAWDNIRQRAMCGMQDTGTAEQRGPGLLGWDELSGFDGNDLAIADGIAGSTAYYSAHRLDGFRRRQCLTPTVCVTSAPTLTVAGTNASLQDEPNIQAYDSIAADDFCPPRVSIAAGGLFESDDGAETFRPVTGLGGGTIEALEYSGMSCDDPARRLYVATSKGVFVRDGGGEAITRKTAYRVSGASVPTAISIDPGNGRSVWIASARSVTHLSLGAGSAPDRVTDVRGDLAGAGTISSIVFVPGVVGGLVFIGTQNGIWMTDEADLGAWSHVTGPLPNVLVTSLEFDPVDGVLLAGTLGRGAWKLNHPKDVDVPPGILGLKPGHGMKGSPVTVKARWEDPDRVRFDMVKGKIDFGDGTGKHKLTLKPGGHFASTHTYAHAGHYKLTVTLTDVPGAVTTKSVTETIG